MASSRPTHARTRRQVGSRAGTSPGYASPARTARRPTVLVFARQPVLGTVKTRLAADIGRVEARRFYRATLTRLLRRLVPHRSWRTVLAVTPDHACGVMARTFRIPAIPQGSGDLGARMRRAAAGQPGPVLIVGTDVPALEPRHLRTAVAALRRHDFVFGPAADGGYWLAGFANRRPVGAIMHNVRWSTPAALTDTVRSAGARARVVILPDILADIDDGSGYAHYRSSGSHRGSGREVSTNAGT